MNRRRLIQSAVHFALIGAPTHAMAQVARGYPDHAIKLLVPFPPGALTDNIGRAVAERLRSVFGQPVVIENRPGAGTLVGASQVAKSSPDGHTLMVATSTTLGIAPFLFSQAPIKITDLTGIAMLGSVRLFVVTHADFPAKSLAELVAMMRKSPGRYNFGSPGNGTVHQLVIEMIKQREHVSAVHIPYQGTIPALTDVIAGRLDFMVIDASAAMPQIKAGKIKALAVTGPKRSALAPEVPAIGEIYKGLNMEAWQAVAGPNGMPAEIQARLHEEINKALDTPEFRQQLSAMGVEARPMTQAAFNDMIRRDALTWQAAIKQSGAKVD